MVAHVVDGTFVPVAHMDDFTLVGVELHLPRLCPCHHCVEVSLQFLLTANFGVIRKLENSRCHFHIDVEYQGRLN